MTERYRKYHNPDMTVEEMIKDPEIKFGAFRIWLRYYRQEEISERIENFVKNPIASRSNSEEKPEPQEPILYKYIFRGHDYDSKFHEPPEPSWLKAIRRSLFLSATSLSEKQNLKRGGFSKMEKSEADGTISLNNLRKAAEALDCELVYALVPKDRIPPAQRVWEVIYPHACKTKFVPNVHKTQRMNGVATAARMLMEDMKFRQEQGWCPHNPVSEIGVFREITRLQAGELHKSKV